MAQLLQLVIDCEAESHASVCNEGVAMAQQSDIEWTNATWNPVAGCSLASAGCAHCYAMRMASRLEAMGQTAYLGTTRKVNGLPVWTGRVNLIEKALRLPLKWKKPRRVFVNSMSDLFHEAVPFDFIDQVFAVMSLCPQHTFQVLTKRPDRMAAYLCDDEQYRRVYRLARLPAASLCIRVTHGDNVWVGASVEDQANANERIPLLLNCPAAIRFLSCEPLLGSIDLNLVSRMPGAPEDVLGGADGIHWVIVGGESGPGARPFVLGWGKEIVRQCQAAGVPVFVKQIGSNPVNREGVRHPAKDSKGGDMQEWPQDLRVREFPREVVHA